MANALDVNREVYEFLGIGLGQVRHRLLEAGRGHHPPGRARELRLPRRHDDRHRQPHAQRRRPRHGRLRRGRRGRRGRDGGLARGRCRTPSSSACASPASCPAGPAPKDVILKVLGHPHREGRHQRDRRILRPRVRRRSRATGKATITQHGRRAGRDDVRSSPTTQRMAGYLRAPARAALAELADDAPRAPASRPRGDREPGEVLRPASSRSTSAKLEPHVVGPHTPDLGRPISDVGKAAARRGLPARRSGRARRLLHQLLLRGHRPRGARGPPGRRRRGSRPRRRCSSRPGSEQVRATIERDGQMADLEAIGATVLANACGPCIGQWKRDDIAKGDGQHDRQRPSTATSPRRNDGNPSTLSLHRLARDRHGHARSPAGSTSTPSPTECLGRRRRGDPPRAAGRATELPSRASCPGDRATWPRRPRQQRRASW